MNTTTRYETVYEVNWDGTRQRGAYLMVEPEVPQAPPRPTGSDHARRGLRGQVVKILIDGPATTRAIAQALGVEMHAVAGALFALRNERVIRVRGSVWNPRRFRREQLYAINEAAR